MSLEALLLLCLIPPATRAFGLRQRYSAAKVTYGQALCSLLLADGLGVAPSSYRSPRDTPSWQARSVREPPS